MEIAPSDGVSTGKNQGMPTFQKSAKAHGDSGTEIRTVNGLWHSIRRLFDEGDNFAARADRRSDQRPRDDPGP